jgi:predicted TIM-barrel fold metal-dependent hydrolase
MPQGIVAYADLTAHDVGDLLAAHAKHPNVPGIRQILNVHRDPLYDYTGRHFMREPAWLAGFATRSKLELAHKTRCCGELNSPGADAPRV